jgi:hypothetical protein
MRCTEGVWMSVTPTRDHLIVSMDFEGICSNSQSFTYFELLFQGVQSIERTAQEGVPLFFEIFDEL